MKHAQIEFPDYSGKRCLMMPYIQGDPDSVPVELQDYAKIIEDIVIKRGDLGYLTIDESPATQGQPHRGRRRKHERALHTEAGRHPDKLYVWGGGGWGRSHRTLLDGDTRVLLANNADDTCAVWDATEQATSLDGDIGHLADKYPYEDATLLQAGEVYDIGILTPHESLPVSRDMPRQFLRIISNTIHGREKNFTNNPLVSWPE